MKDTLLALTGLSLCFAAFAYIAHRADQCERKGGNLIAAGMGYACLRKDAVIK